MPRHTRNTRGQTTADAFPLAAVVLFLSGCASEAYLLLIRRYLLNGTYRQMTVFLYALPILGWIGAALAAFGALWLVSAIRQKRGVYLAAEGIDLAALSFLCRYVPASLAALLAIVPAATLLGIVWLLYDRESALSLTVLGGALWSTWFCRNRFGVSPREARTFALVVLILLAAALGICAGGRGRFRAAGKGGTQFLAAAALSFAALLACLPGALPAHYAMWTLALTAFGFAVYDTVKQL